jgi:hypothetical protein
MLATQPKNAALGGLLSEIPTSNGTSAIHANHAIAHGGATLKTPGAARATPTPDSAARATGRQRRKRGGSKSKKIMVKSTGQAF